MPPETKDTKTEEKGVFVKFLGSKVPGRTKYVCSAFALDPGEIAKCTPEKLEQLMEDFPGEFKASSGADYQAFKDEKKRLAIEAKKKRESK